jgi:hypothetical protein
VIQRRVSSKENRGRESSTVLAFRIFVMLSCLIIVPMAAIFGSAFPEVVKSVLVDRIVSWSTGKPFETTRATIEGGFSEVKPASGANTAQWEAPHWGLQAGAAEAWPQQGPTTGSPTTGVIPAGAQGTPASGTQPAGFSAAVPRSSAPNPLERTAADHTAPGKQPVAYPANSLATPGDSAPAALGRAAVQSLEQPDRFTTMERKLREFGATYYLLETWGNEGDLYRFHCRMAVGNNSNNTRHFEATDRDALKAMAQVLERVEAWRAGRLP